MNSVWGGMVTEKILLITIIFLLFYLPLHFFRRIFNDVDSFGAEYAVSLAYAVNPFVYERFLAGQWAVVFGYALLVPFISYLFDFCRIHEPKNGIKLAAILFIFEIVSLHYFVAAIIVTALAFTAHFIVKKDRMRFALSILILSGCIILTSLYWTLPAFLSHASQIASFGPGEWQVFKTVGTGQFGVLQNVLILRGFWEEGQIWATLFLISQSGIIYVLSLCLTALLILFGVYEGLRKKDMRNRYVFLLGIGILAVVFSCGTGDGIFNGINVWIFRHVPFWKGFRDSQKWSGLLALFYVFSLGLGVAYLQSLFKGYPNKRIIVFISMMIPILLTPMMLFGFGDQLHAVEYPESWKEVNDVLKNDPSCKALFLPWHEYYSLRFNDDMLTANVARSYFDCNVTEGEDMELGNIRTQGGNGVTYDEIEREVTENTQSPDATVEFLKQNGFDYIIFTDDLVRVDPYRYPFLNSKELEKVMNRGGIYLYRII